MKKLIYTLVILALVSSVTAQWQPDLRLTNALRDSRTSCNNAWCVSSNGNVVHVVWNDNRDGINYYNIYYKRSTDQGITWGADIKLTNSSSAGNPSVAVSGSFVHVVWVDYRDVGEGEIYFKRSTDSGLTWGADTRLTYNSAMSDYLSFAVSGSVVHVVWRDRRNGYFQIYYKCSIDAGISWGTDTPLTGGVSQTPSVTVSGPVVHVVWRDESNEIYYKRSTNDGVYWGADTRLTNNPYNSLWPSIAVSGSNVHIVWDDNRDGTNNYEIYYKRSTDAGMNWGIDTRLTNNSANSEIPSVAVSGSYVHVVWYDTRDSINSSEIYYKRSTNSGVTWGADTRLTNNSAYSGWPSVAVSGSVVHVVWYDERDGNSEIYYKRDPTGNSVGINNISMEIPSSYSLGQNYPNPFNPSTKIKFNVANGFPVGTSGNDKIVLKVYDEMGREVQTLVNESLKPGTYEVSFDGSQLTSGVYFYKLITDSYSETKKMLMIK